MSERSNVLPANQSQDSNSGARMKKSIGLLGSISIIVGSIIGSGIFISPIGILVEVHSYGLSLLMWVACGFFSLLGAYCYAELGTMIHRSGGDYYYMLNAFGPFMGFLRLWAEVMCARPATIAVCALAFARYTLQPFYPASNPTRSAEIYLALSCIVAICLVNCISVKVSLMVQNLFTIAKIAALLIIIITGLVELARGHVTHIENSFEGTKWRVGGIAMAFYSGLFAYAGWNYLNCMIEEMENPRRHLPVAIVVSCTIVTIVYLMANLSYMTVISVEEMLNSSAVALTFAKRIYGKVWWMMSVFVALSCFGGCNGIIMTASRIFFVAGQEKQMPRLLALLHMKRLTPIPSVIFTCVVTAFYAVTPSIYSLIIYLGFVQWLAIGLCVFIVIVFRKTRPEAVRPVKAPIIFPIIYVTVTAILVVYSFIEKPFEALIGMIIILTAVPVYLLGIVWKRKPRVFRKFMHAVTTGLQKLMQLVPSE
ncbi:unnamed protein product [Calicophoron daubneyi]|uniref:Amino acid transporter n=1 Tax=Calicophoron daubneyi TaxID=300641 RepID=A0AAV2THK1_CALDB